MAGRIQQIAEYDLDVRADSYLRYVCVDGETMFLLATVDDPDLACQVTAFDVSRGVVVARMNIPYIKHDNGGGELSAAAAGKRVAVGSEFSINVYDLVDGEFVYCTTLDTEQGTCRARFLGPDSTLHWNVSSFEWRDLNTGKSRLGPESDDSLENFVIEPDGWRLVAIGDVERNPPGYRTTLHRVATQNFSIVTTYKVPGYVVPDFVVAEDGHAYLLSSTCLIDLNLETGKSMVLADRIVGATLSGFSTCMRMTPDGLLHIVTHAELLSIPSTGLDRIASPFGRSVQAAGFDAHGRLWTFDDAQKAVGWELT